MGSSSAFANWEISRLHKDAQAKAAADEKCKQTPGCLLIKELAFSEATKNVFIDLQKEEADKAHKAQHQLSNTRGLEIDASLRCDLNGRFSDTIAMRPVNSQLRQQEINALSSCKTSYKQAAVTRLSTDYANAVSNIHQYTAKIQALDNRIAQLKFELSKLDRH